MLTLRLDPGFPRAPRRPWLLSWVLLLAAPEPAAAVDDHLLLCEVALAKSDVELVELVNPTSRLVPLHDHYLTDDRDYGRLPGVSGAGPSPDLHRTDFIVRFPDGAVLAPGGVAVVALDGQGFAAAYGRRADFEVLGTDPATPDMVAVILGAEAGLTDGGEGVTLFAWDGVSDRVADVDMVRVGDPSLENDLADKTGLAVDGPDAGSVPSLYRPDGYTMPRPGSAPGDGRSTKRIAFEDPDEAAGAGNGVTGDDETTEDVTRTWDRDYTAPNPGACCLTLDCYYEGVDLSDPGALRRTLHERIAGHRRFSYEKAWEVLEAADQDPVDEGAILDLYRNATYPKVSGRGTFYEREHSWPKSFGFPNEGDVPYSDGHALFLADEGYNGLRSNRPYRACQEPDCTELPTEDNHDRGGPGPRENSNWGRGSREEGSWETWIGRRGDVARAQLYMDVRYEGEGDEPDLILTDRVEDVRPRDDGTGYMGKLSTLLAWHREDPVDDLERVRDGVIHRFQRNRNPFVDHPDWAECLFGGLCAVETDEVPDFRVFVTFWDGEGRPTVGTLEPSCIPETLCVSGAVPGRSEVFVRVVGPKPNGYLWPTLVKFSTSRVDVRLHQVSTGLVRTYRLEGAAPGSSELPGLFDRTGFQPAASAISRADGRPPLGPRAGEPPPPPPGEPLLSEHFPGFRFHVRFGGEGAGPQARKEPVCIPETLCVSGAVPGRSEAFLRIVGPKPNGYLWPTLVKFSTSEVEVWIEQVVTGITRYYRLEGASPGSSDLTGRFDRTGFRP